MDKDDFLKSIDLDDLPKVKTVPDIFGLLPSFTKTEGVNEPLLEAFKDLPAERSKFSEERYFRLENVVYNLLLLLESGKGLGKNDTCDFMHYLEFGEWK